MTPAGLPAERLLVLLDLSWWLTRAWEIAVKAIRETLALTGAEPAELTAEQHAAAAHDMIATVIGWTVKLLSPPMAWGLAAVLDSVGPTWRHERTKELPVERRYKANRPKRPLEYHRATNVILRLFALHRIPLLSAEGFEADDGIATAVRLARAAGLTVAMVSADKDLAALVGEGVWQWAWGGGPTGIDDIRGAAEVLAKYGVPPNMIRDWLAIMGDDGDGVRGADGIGDVWARNLLLACECERAALVSVGVQVGSALDRAFAANIEAPSDDATKTSARELARLRKLTPNSLEDTSAAALQAKVLEASRRHEALKLWKALARASAKLKAQRPQVELARELVTLRDDAPIHWDLAELPIGGWNVGEIQQALAALGFGRLAGVIESKPKVRLTW